MITLKKALEQNRLSEFIAQEEARGVQAIEGSELNRVLELVIKPPQSKDQTSRSASRDGSRGK